MTYQDVGAWSGHEHPHGAVVVAYNGKPHSQAALVWGAQEAARTGLTLLVLYAANYPGMTIEPGPGMVYREPGALEAAEEVTAGGVAQAQAAYPTLRVLGATEVTSPTRALIEASTRAAVVVLGSRGYGRVGGVLLRSVAFTVAAQATCPVIVVKDEAAVRSVGPDHPVVVGTDGSPAAAAALDFAAERAARDAAALGIVACTGEAGANVDHAQLRIAAEKIASQAADRVRARHPELVVTTDIEDCPAEVALVRASTTAGLVVVGTRGRGAFRGFLLGSVSHAVIHGADCAVAVIE